MHGKEAELLMAGFVYVARCLAEGDTATLRRMGLGWPDLRALNRLGLGDVLHLVRQAATAPFLEIRFDRATFQRQLERLEAQRQAEDQRLALLQGDAPQAMLHDLFGTTLKEYYTYRRLLGLGPCAERRPRAPDDATLRAVWRAWQAHGLDRLPEGPQPEHYLALHQATGLSLRTIWPLAREWVSAGLRTRAGN
ncbi:MAG: STY4526/YPO1902 family pathogenicity island replication protein [Candidatus Contendobacter sp.]|nr:STY4526/YPO1902 family pathogenicity island replication protein [Candidatus Contendobacter sp.]